MRGLDAIQPFSRSKWITVSRDAPTIATARSSLIGMGMPRFFARLRACAHAPLSVRCYTTGGGFIPKGKASAVKGSSSSSTQWLRRQATDRFVKAAHDEGYRSRSAFKLLQLDDKFHFLLPGHTVVDLGARPGGWTQVAVGRVRAEAAQDEHEDGGRVDEDSRSREASSEEPPAHAQSQDVDDDIRQEDAAAAKPTRRSRIAKKAGRVVSVDIEHMAGVDGATVVLGDFTKAATQTAVLAALGGRKADVVLSDMAPNAVGVPEVNHLQTHNLVKCALSFATKTLANGGTFVCKHFNGEKIPEFRAQLRTLFETVKDARPEAIRKESSEFYLVARGFKGRPTTTNTPPGN